MRVCKKRVIYLGIKRKYTWQKKARISWSRNDCKYTWEKTARISCHNFETNGRPYHSSLAGVRGCRRKRQLSCFAIGCWLFVYWDSEDLNDKQFSPSRNYPGPRGFSWFFFAKEIKTSRKAATTSRESDEEREKNFWLPWPWISLSCRRQGQDNIFSNTQTNLIGSFNCIYRGDAEDFHTSFCLSLPGKKIVCMLHSQ